MLRVLCCVVIKVIGATTRTRVASVQILGTKHVIEEGITLRRSLLWSPSILQFVWQVSFCVNILSMRAQS